MSALPSHATQLDPLPAIAEVYEWLKGEPLAEPVGDERRGWCLAVEHGDNGSPSASYNIAKDTFNCFTCKEQGGVLKLVVTAGRADTTKLAVGALRQAGLMPEQSPAQADKVTFDWSSATIYDYHDADGALLYQVGRCGSGKGKTFRQRRPDGAGGWIAKLDDVERVPFGLPELRSAIAAKRQVFVVEGEQDVLTLREHGFDATTSAQGAKWTWTPDFAEHFRGANVVLLGDNDPPGRLAVEHRCEVLDNVASTLHAIDALPGVGEHEDITDWLTTHKHSADELKTLVAATKPYDRAARFGITWQPVIAERGVQPVEWDIEGLFERYSGPTLLTAPPEMFKSWFAMFVGMAMATGKPLFGQFDVPKARPWVFHLNLDAGRIATENRIAMLGSAPIPNYGIMSWPEWDAVKFEQLMRSHPGAFVVIDCFSNIFINGDAKVEQAEQMRTFVQELRNLFEQYGTNGIVIDHTPRNDGRRSDPGELFYGSQQKKATFRQGITLVRPPEDKDEADEAAPEDLAPRNGRVPLRGPAPQNIIQVHCLKMSEAEKFQPFDVEFAVVGGYMTAKVLGNVVSAKKVSTQKRLDADKSAIRKAFQEGGNAAMSSATIRSITGLAQKRVYEALADVRLFDKTGGSKNTVYSVKPDELRDEF